MKLFEQVRLRPVVRDPVNCQSVRLPGVLQLVLVDGNYLPDVVQVEPRSITDNTVELLNCSSFRI